MQITCQNCEKLNNINLERKVNCGSCHQEIVTYKEGKFNFTGTTLTTALLVAVGGGYVFNEYIEDKRYPIEAEYALIESCSTYDRVSLSKVQFEEKRNLCICALEKTEDNILYKDIDENTEDFITELKNNIKICGGQTSADF